ncbi:MAG TPA: Mth938-like domain-containing protein [Burkholderiales bacterium]|nr:Mth938-like domain-containing protein [Burkholderiales bacterium]
MKLHQTRAHGRNLFTGYGPGYVSVNGTRWESSVIVLPDRTESWGVAGFDALTEGIFTRLAELPIEILLLGSGARLRFPHPRLTQALMRAGIGLEVMDTPAACRTYNFLLEEGRRVAAALLIEAAPGRQSPT